MRLFAQSRRERGRTVRTPRSQKGGEKTKFYTNKPTWYAYPEDERPRDKHATISVLKYKTDKLSAVDTYLGNCEQRFTVEYLKRNPYPTEQTWKDIMASTNAQYFPRGKNTV